MKTVLEILKKPFHLALLPIYFVFHKLVEFWGILDTGNVIIPLLLIYLGALAAFSIFYLLFRNKGKAAVAATMSLLLYLFFGDIKYTFSGLPVLRHIAHYRFFIPLTALLLIIGLLLIRKSQKTEKASLFLNTLLLIYLLFDLIIAVVGNTDGNRITIEKASLSVTQQVDSGGNRPNIYYIVADGYPSPGIQQDTLQMKGYILDSSLTAKKFKVIRNSNSNYSNTAFSIASLFALNYLQGVDTTYQMAPYHYNRAIEIVKKSPFISLLRNQGYTIFNYSIFDLEDAPALKKDKFLSATPGSIIFYSTLFSCVKKDILWQIIPGYAETIKKTIRKNRRTVLSPQKTYNKSVIDSLHFFLKREKHSNPFFVYAHIKMPHFPYFYDSAGTELPYDTVFKEPMIRNKKRFAGYIYYTNRIIDTLVSEILKKGNGKDIVIVQSDHGTEDFGVFDKKNSFKNFSALYFPGQGYASLYDGMSNVNTFRIILNNFFGYSLPLLPDKTYYIK